MKHCEKFLKFLNIVTKDVENHVWTKSLETYLWQKSWIRRKHEIEKNPEPKRECDKNPKSGGNMKLKKILNRKENMVL